MSNPLKPLVICVLIKKPAGILKGHLCPCNIHSCRVLSESDKERFSKSRRDLARSTARFASLAFRVPTRNLEVTPSMSFWPPRWATILVVFAAAAASVVAFPSAREPLLRAAGWALVVSEPAAPADIIVISLDSAGAGALEAADLVQSGIATRVAVFADPPSGEDYEFIRRGLPYEDESAKQIRQLTWLGVTDVMQIPRTEAGTEGESQVLAPWCGQHQFRSIVFVSARDHSRRVRRMLDRVMKSHPTRVTVRPARYSSFDPDRWWKTRGGLRTEIVELQKLVLDFILHPISF